MTDALRRLVTVEAKAMPTMQPLSVFMSRLAAMPPAELRAQDAALLDFVSFRVNPSERASSVNNASNVSANARDASRTPPFLAAGVNWPPQRAAHSPDRKFVMFCDSSVLFNRSVPELLQYLPRSAPTAAGDPKPTQQQPQSASPLQIHSFVLPFSSLVLLRMQAAQADSGAVSNAFRVTVFSQIRQLTHLQQQQQQQHTPESKSSLQGISVLAPSLEIELWRRVGVLHGARGFPESTTQLPVLAGEAAFHEGLMPRLAHAAQMEFGAVAGKSCVSAVGSLHSGVHRACLRSGIWCHSLPGASEGSDSTGGTVSDSANRRSAAAQARSIAAKLHAMTSAPSRQGS